MDDFNENVLTCTDIFWALTADIKPILININHNNCIQTLYSHKENCTDFLAKPSYLVIAFSKDVELIILRKIIPYFLARFNTDTKSNFNYHYNYPKLTNDDKIKDGNSDLAARIDKEYFNINNIRFELTSNQKEIHDKFWEEIETKLKELNVTQNVGYQ